MITTRVRTIAGSLFLAMVLSPSSYTAELKLDSDLTVHYQVTGTGQIPIVFVPGWTMSTTVFDKQLAHFAHSTRYRFYTFDPRGQGKSSKTEGGHFYEQHGRDLFNFLRKLGLRNVVLGGWSYGGFDVLAYIREYGVGNVRALIMIDAPPKSIGNDNKEEWVWFSRDDADGSRRAFTMDTLLDRRKMDENFVRWMLERPTPENIRELSNICNETPGTIAALLNETGAYEDYEVELAAQEGRLPLLFAVREEMGDPARRWATKHTPSATVTSFGKHLNFWERPAQFNAVLDRFLATFRNPGIGDFQKSRKSEISVFRLPAGLLGPSYRSRGGVRGRAEADPAGG
jgi:non-heme chloroperoxidase